METKFVSFVLGTAIGLASPLVPLRAQFAYVVNGSNNVSGFGAVSAFSIGSNGALTPVPGSPFAMGGGPTSVAVDTTGKFAYVVNSQRVSGVSGYSTLRAVVCHGQVVPDWDCPNGQFAVPKGEAYGRAGNCPFL